MGACFEVGRSLRDRGVGGGGGHVPHSIFKSEKKCLVPPPIEALMVPPNLKVAPLSLSFGFDGETGEIVELHTFLVPY